VIKARAGACVSTSRRARYGRGAPRSTQARPALAAFALALFAALTSALGACGDDDDAAGADGGADVANDAPAADGSPDVVAEDSAPVPVFGLDTRPANKGCVAPPRPAATPVAARWTRAYASLPLPTQTVDLIKQGSFFYVVHQTGKIFRFDSAPATSTFTTPLDISAAVDSVFEGGLLSIAFHPKFVQNGFLYVYYTRKDAQGFFFVRVARFTSPDGGATFDKSTEHVILEYVARENGHTGGRLVFGPDGYLYFSTGDSFFPNDAQLTSDIACADVTPCPLTGKMLRMDIDGADPYAIPPTNPFASGGGRKEVWAWGFRNPFRFSFDRATGEMWLGDVGELLYEEINRVAPGGNYGWPRLDGPECKDVAGCAGLIAPAIVVPNSLSSACTDATTCARALVGGVVYRGASIPEAYGAYFFGDEISGNQFVARPDPVTGALVRSTINPAGPQISPTGYAEDETGEVWMTDYFGQIWHLVRDASEPSAAPAFPAKLTATGCVDPADPTRPAPGVIPYQINVPFWSDGAEKERYFAIPDGTSIAVMPDGDLDLPVGSVTMKTFRLGGVPIETRLFVHHTDGWAGYTYEWQDDGKDAVLLPGGKTKKIGGQTWSYPSRAECLQCHSSAAGFSLGLELPQLARLADYPGRPARDQIGTLDHVGFFAPGSQLTTTPLPRLDGPDPVTARARAMLHASCSGCHRPNGPTSAMMDLRFTTALADTKTCDVIPTRGTMGIEGARLLAPAAPAKSILLARMQALDVWRMPPIASHVVDPQGTQLLSAMIQATTTCP